MRYFKTDIVNKSTTLVNINGINATYWYDFENNYCIAKIEMASDEQLAQIIPLTNSEITEAEAMSLSNNALQTFEGI